MSGPYVHGCGHPGCRAWGGYGRRRVGGDGKATYDWRCREHLWPDFYGPKGAGREKLPPLKVATDPKTGQGRLL